MDKVTVLGISFDAVSSSEAVGKIVGECKNRRGLPFFVVTPNPIMVMNAREDEALAKVLDSADLSLADGIGIISASRRMGKPLPERVTGIDTAQFVLCQLANVGGRIYLLGGNSGVAEKAGKTLKEYLPGLSIVGTHHGYFDDDESIIADINGKSPDLLAVCLGSPSQEKWVYNNMNKLSGVGVVICLGGALDVWSGNVKRAPEFFINMHIEWLWRMLREPKRFSELPKMLKFRCLTRKSRQKAASFK